MALSRVKTWISGEVLTAVDQNAEFDNILNNALTLISPLTGTLNANTNQVTNLLLERRSSVATAGNEARIYYRTDVDIVQVDDGATIRNVPSAAAGTAKGAMILGTGTDTFGALAVSTNGYIPIADSTQTTGVRWGAAAEVTGFNGPAIFYGLPLWLPTP